LGGVKADVVYYCS